MIRSTPIVWKNLVIIGSDDGYLTALDQNLGEIIWRYRTGDAIVAGPTIYDSKLYVGSLDRRVHAFQLEQIIQNGN
jgi:outer membrane protein assembly factor BamB